MCPMAVGPDKTVLYKRYIASIGGFQLDTSAAIALAGRIYYCLLEIPFKLTIDGIGCLHSGVAAGNLFLAIYDSVDEAPKNRLGVTVDTPASGINQKQLIALSGGNLQLNPGLYFLALHVDNNTDTYWSNVESWNIINPSNINHGPSLYNQDQTYGAPPVTATPLQDGSERPYCLFVRVTSVP